MQEKSYVVNLHIIEACNYHCKHCFAYFDSTKLLSLEDWKLIVDRISSTIPVKRFNIAGGEPLLYPKLYELVQYISKKGFEVSIITNGYLITEQWIDEYAPYLSTIGLSIDSVEKDTLHFIGRETVNQEILSQEKLETICEKIKQKGIGLKINTVISKATYQSDMNEFLQKVQPDRWKVLKMKEFANARTDNRSLNITDSEFNSFLKKHTEIPNQIIESSLVHSYIIIDANGCLINNDGLNHTITANLLDNDYKEKFMQFKLDEELYFSRYK